MSKRNMLLALASLLIAAGSAYAQSARFDVPFQFTVEKTLMPAGYYSIGSAYSGSAALIIQNSQRTRIFNTSALVQSLGARGQAKLVFQCYSGSCFLSQVWTGNDVGRQLRKSAQELELAKQGPAVHVPVVAALR